MTQPIRETSERLGQCLGTGRTAQVYRWGEAHVVKLFRAEFPPAWVEHEFAVAHSVTEAGLPTPAPGDALIEIAGRLGIIYARVSGPTMLAVMQQQPALLPVLAKQFGELHARIHACAGANLPAQQSALARAIDHAPMLSAAVKQQLLQRLAQLPGGATLCHSDFHPENVVLTAHGPMIIDWMTACAGNPIADIARTVLILRVAQPPEGSDAPPALFVEMKQAFLAGYLEAYQMRCAFAPAKIDPWLPLLAAARLSEQIAGEEESLLRLAGVVERAAVSARGLSTINVGFRRGMNA